MNLAEYLENCFVLPEDSYFGEINTLSEEETKVFLEDSDKYSLTDEKNGAIIKIAYKNDQVLVYHISTVKNSSAIASSSSAIISDG